jgi:beta-carotene ketolase (CrtW type)|tara:strand:- start:53151 stop:53909 length:759 start_codon:yes stop_codon:yes gene_type:complete
MSATRQSLIGLGIAGLFVLSWLGVHFGAIFTISLGWETLGLTLALIVLQSWLSTALFISAHDAMHGSLAPRWPRLQRAVGRLALMIYAGIDYRAFEPKHFDHHKHVGTGRDPDFHVENPRQFAPWLVAFFSRYYTHAQIGRITLVAIIYMLTGAGLANIVVFWAVPALLALLQLFYFGTYLPHRHGEDTFADRHRARSTRFPELLSLLTCFHFGGYHHEHHLYPSEPWWRLPARRQRERSKSSAYEPRRSST